MKRTEQNLRTILLRASPGGVSGSAGSPLEGASVVPMMLRAWHGATRSCRRGKPFGLAKNRKITIIITSHHYCHQSSCHAHSSSVTHAAFHLFVRSVLPSFLPVMECTWREARNACHVLANSLNMGSASLAPFLFVPVSCFLRSR